MNLFSIPQAISAAINKHKQQRKEKKEQDKQSGSSTPRFSAKLDKCSDSASSSPDTYATSRGSCENMVAYEENIKQHKAKQFERILGPKKMANDEIMQSLQKYTFGEHNDSFRKGTYDESDLMDDLRFYLALTRK